MIMNDAVFWPHLLRTNIPGMIPTAFLWCADVFPSGEAEVKDAKKGIRAKLLGFYMFLWSKKSRLPAAWLKTKSMSFGRGNHPQAAPVWFGKSCNPQLGKITTGEATQRSSAAFTGETEGWPCKNQAILAVSYPPAISPCNRQFDQFSIGKSSTNQRWTVQKAMLNYRRLVRPCLCYHFVFWDGFTLPSYSLYYLCRSRSLVFWDGFTMFYPPCCLPRDVSFWSTEVSTGCELFGGKRSE